MHWALDNIYIGPPCPEMCHGHGKCDYPQCLCDDGFIGDYCQNTKNLPVVL